jgi:hypothetical protein
MLLILAAYRNIMKIDTADGYKSLSSFGFEPGGLYAVSFSGFDAELQYCFGLIPPASLALFANSSAQITPCQGSDDYSHAFGGSVTPSFTGRIASKSVYVPFIIFQPPVKSKLIITINQSYRNPHSFLDSRWNGILIEKSICLVLLIALISYWCLNWFHHFTVQIGIHYLLTAVFATLFFYQICRTIRFSILNRSDTAGFFEILHLTFRTLVELSACVTVLLIAKGWCIIHDTIPLRDVFASLAYSLVFISLGLCLEYVNSPDVSSAIALLMTIAMVLFLHVLISNTNDATRHILAHLLAIANIGINPRTTPIYHKHELYKKFHAIILGACVEMLVYFGMKAFFEVSFVLDEAVFDFIPCSIAVAMCVVFRLQPAGQAPYARIDPERGEIALADLESVNVNSDQMSGGRSWEEGMALPGMPEIVRTVDTRVVLASPDGMDTVDAKVGDDTV